MKKKSQEPPFTVQEIKEGQSITAHAASDGNIPTKNNLITIQQELQHAFAQAIWTASMEAKQALEAEPGREAVISNFATTAPRSEFIINTDISDPLANGVEGATIYVSTDGQSTWQSSAANFLGTPGYENTWEGIINTNDGSSAYSYLSGLVDYEALEEDFGTILVSGSPHNVNGNWPPGDNMYATLANDESGDTSSDYDIVNIRATYKDGEATDSDGNTYTDAERFYLSLGLSGDCCHEGGFFGPWYLYAVGIVNPNAEENVAYAIAYGNGGFGQLTPGLLKITGDLATGEVGGFEYISTNITYSTAGNDMQATALMSLLTGDNQWGPWPNSYGGFIVLGITVEAALDGLDVAADIKDQTDPGLFILNTTFQEGNTPLVISNPNFNETTNMLSVSYSDSDGNLPWYKAALICNTAENGGNCFTQINMIPDTHTYEDGVTFTAEITQEIIDQSNLSGAYEAHFWFADDDMVEYPNAQIELSINVGAGGCALGGDTNSDGVLNVLDVVSLVNIILDANTEGDPCSDINNDGAFNILDIVLQVNSILGQDEDSTDGFDI